VWFVLCFFFLEINFLGKHTANFLAIFNRLFITKEGFERLFVVESGPSFILALRDFFHRYLRHRKMGSKFWNFNPVHLIVEIILEHSLFMSYNSRKNGLSMLFFNH